MKEIQQIEPSKPEEESNEKKGQFKVKFNPSMIKTYDEILKLVSNPKAKYQIADARGANAFFGKENTLFLSISSIDNVQVRTLVTFRVRSTFRTPMFLINRLNS